MEKENVIEKEIRLDIIVAIILNNWKTYIKPMIATLVITVAIVLCIPRTYTVSVKLAPEYGNNGSDLSSMASMVGINLGTMSSNDAIVPLYYPDLVESTQFCVPLFDVEVSCANSDFKGTYMQYLATQTKQTPWGYAMFKLRQMFKKKETVNHGADYKISPFHLSKAEYFMYLAVSSSIKCSFDKKTEVISISTTAQDPLVAAQFADSVMHHLQDFIVEYRTCKARGDCEHYATIANEKKELYEAALASYCRFADSNADLHRPSMLQKDEKLQSELQNAYDEYVTANRQLALAQTKLTERTPAFTVLQNATVPIKPTAPKRMIIVAGMLFLCFVATTAYLIVKRTK